MLRFSSRYPIFEIQKDAGGDCGPVMSAGVGDGFGKEDRLRGWRGRFQDLSEKGKTTRKVMEMAIEWS